MSTLPNAPTLPDVSTPRGRLEYLPIMLRRVHAEGRPFDMLCFSRCVIGHACQDPLLQEQGLAFDSPEAKSGPRFRKHRDFDIGPGFFGVSMGQSNYLFCTIHAFRGVRTALDAAQCIETWLAENPAP